MSDSAYIHGTDPAEQSRLGAFNELVNESFLGFLDLTGARTILEVGSGLGVLPQKSPVVFLTPRSPALSSPNRSSPRP